MWNTEKKKALKRLDAIDILKRQIGKLEDPTYPTTDLWAVQTSAFIKKFFGKDSEEYEFIRSIKVRGEYGKLTEWTKQDKDLARLFLKQCIQVIERIDLYQPPRENIFRTMRSDILISAFLVIWGGSFLFGQHVGSVTSSNNTFELKEGLRINTDSLTTYRKNMKELNKKFIDELQSKTDSLKIYRNTIDGLNRKLKPASNQKPPAPITSQR